MSSTRKAAQAPATVGKPAAPVTRSTGTAGEPVEEWTRDEVTAWLAEQGRPCAPATWSSYVTRAGAPKPHRHVGRTPLWDAQAVREWHARRAGQGWRAQNGGGQQ